jgi:hypothetical protein
MDGEFIQISDPSELSTNFVDCKLAVARDFDGLLTGTVLFNGLPVAYITHPDSNYGDAPGEHNMPGMQHIIAIADPSQEQVYANFLVWIGEANEDFPGVVAGVQARKEGKNDIWQAMDEFADMLGDGHGWCAFFDDLENKLYERYGAAGEWPRPNEWYGAEMQYSDSAMGSPSPAQVDALLGESM